MSVVRRRFFASPFLCARSETGDVSKDAPQSEAHLREYVVCLWFPTMWMVLTWALIALNYAILQPVCGWIVQIGGHAVLLLTLRSYALAAHTHPGSPTEEWNEEARVGLVPSTVCKRSGKLLPPRARYVGRAGEVVLSLDHYCTYIGLPVGHYNRAYFLQFLAYASLLCLVGIALCVAELFTSPTAASLRRVMLHLPSLSPPMGVPGGSAEQLAKIVPQEVHDFLALGWTADHTRVAAVGYTLIANVLATAFLGALTWWQWGLAIHGRTTVAPKDATYDRGSVRDNLELIFGPHVLLWWAPLRSVRPASSGLESYDGFAGGFCE